MRVFAVVDAVSVLLFELGKFNRHGEIDGFGVAEIVAHIVGESADGEGQFVGGASVAEETTDEVAGADVVHQVAVEGFTERVVADILYGAAAVGVGVGFTKLRGGEIGKAGKQQRTDGGLPGEVDELFVGLKRVGQGGPGCEEERQQSGRLEQRGSFEEADDECLEVRCACSAARLTLQSGGRGEKS